MSSSLLLQQCPAYLECPAYIWMVLEMGGKWPYSCCFQDFFSMTCSIQSSSHLVFSLYILSASKWCIHIVELTQLLLGRNPVLFYRISQTSIWSITYQWQSTPSWSAYVIRLKIFLLTYFIGGDKHLELSFYLPFSYWWVMCCNCEWRQFKNCLKYLNIIILVQVLSVVVVYCQGFR